MSNRPTVSIAGLSKADVLAALFNAAEAPRRMGALQFQSGPYVMTKEWAAELTDLGNTATPDYGGINLPGRPELYFDYLYGRCLKLDLTDDNTFDPWGFDRDNGGDGSAQKVIDHLRQTGEVSTTPNYEARVWLQKVVDESLKRYDEGDLGGAIAQFFIGTAPRHQAHPRVGAHRPLAGHGLPGRTQRGGEGHGRLRGLATNTRASMASGYGLKPGFTVSVMLFLTPCLLVVLAP